MAYECFTCERRDHVALVKLNRPERRNAMCPSFFDECTALFRELDADDDVRAIVLAAEGKSFTSGLDLTEAAALLTEATPKGHHDLKKRVHWMQDAFTAIEKCRKPVIAAIHHYCIGGGIDMITACDIRLASKDAVFSVREVQLAMVADLGTLQRLPPLIGEGHTRELALTGRDFDADEALRIGLVTHVYGDKDAVQAAALAMARDIAALPPLAVQGIKEELNFGRDATVVAGLDHVAVKNASMLPSEDLMEAMQAFMEKRKPQFNGR